MTEYLLAYDLGTTGVKAGILSPDGRLLAAAYREYGISYPGPGWAEQSVDEMWEAQCAVTRELFETSEIPPAAVAAVGVSCQRATFVPLDRDGSPLTPFIGWQDRRSVEQCEQMEQAVGGEEYYRIAGLPIEPTAAVSKILWLKAHRPDIFERASVFASTHNLHLRQLGVENPPCDLPDAAYMGLLDVDRLAWSEDLLDRLGIPLDKMPPLAPSGVVAGEVSTSAAAETGLAAGTRIVTAGGDLQVAGVGLGITEPGFASVGVGTGGGILIYLDKPLRHPRVALNCLPHAVAGAWEMEGICLASGAAYRWFRDTLCLFEKQAASTLNLDTYDILNMEAADVPPGAEGVLVMPSFMGAGSPNWYPGARGVILGLTLSTGRKTLTRAMLEGICLEIRWIFEAAAELGTELSHVRIWGGAAKSPLWNQIASDVYGIPVARTEVADAGLVGAAICAGVGIGWFEDARQGAREMVRVAESYRPNPDLRALYDDKFELYKKTYRALTEGGIFEQVAR